ncbi:MAG: trigger factor [Deltaproteobacteria bacterium]|jgi:trigger factor|nr:trigger factor [Deltaproteobacteria bacterium]
MQHTAEDLTATVKQISLEIPFDDFSDEYNDLIQQLTQIGTYKGFRPGRAPKTVVANKHSKYIVERLTQTVIARNVEELLKELNIHPVTTPVLSKAEIKDGKPLRCVFSFEYVPDFEVPDYGSFEIGRLTPNVTDEMVDMNLADLAKKASTIMEAPADRGAAPNDRVKLSYEVRDSEGKIIVDLGENFFDLDATVLYPELEEAIFNRKVGDSFSVDVTLPNDLNSAIKKGDKLTYNIKILEMFIRTVPSLDDEFAKDLNVPDVNNFEELRRYIRETLLAYQETAIQDDVDDQICNLLVERCSLELPNSLIEAEVDKRIVKHRDYVQNKKQVELKDTLDSWLKNEPLRAKFRKQSIFSTKIGLILSKIIGEQQISVSDEEVETVTKNILGEYQSGLTKEPDTIDTTNAAYKNKLLTEKTMGFLRSKVRMVDFAPDGEAAGAPGSDAPQGQEPTAP